MSLTGKVALVTGSTSGIGLAIARAFAAAGAKVMLNGFGDAGEIERLKAELEAAHDGADLSDPAAIERMLAHCTEALGSPDILVNNAGIQHVAPVDQFPPAKWDAILAINLSAVFHTTRLALPGMRAKGWGRIVNTASAHSLVASPNKSAYVAAKRGIGLEQHAFGVDRGGVTRGACLRQGRDERRPPVAQPLAVMTGRGGAPVGRRGRDNRLGRASREGKAGKYSESADHRVSAYCAVQPPSIDRLAPVIDAAPSEQR